MRYELVLWDFDGTLADSSKDVWASVLWAAETCNASLPLSFYSDNANLSKGTREIFNNLMPYPGDGMYQLFSNNINIHYRTMNRFLNTSLYPGLELLLLEMRQWDISSVIVTNKPLKALEKILTCKVWSVHFRDWITPDSMENTTIKLLTKAVMISLMLTKYNVEPSHCVYVGDSYKDIYASHNNGIDSIAVTYGDGNTKELLASMPTYYAHSPKDIGAIILQSSSI